MRYVITANWKTEREGDSEYGEFVHHNPTVVECDDRQDAFRIAQMISMSRGFHYLEIRDKDASLD
jgi:hypothetical protein